MGHFPHMRERGKNYWVVPNRMFKLLLKHERVDTRNNQFYLICWEDPHSQMLRNQRDQIIPCCYCTEAGEKHKVCSDVHAYQVHCKIWSDLPGLDSILSGLKHWPSAFRLLPRHSMALRLTFTRLPRKEYIKEIEVHILAFQRGAYHNSKK